MKFFTNVDDLCKAGVSPEDESWQGVRFRVVLSLVIHVVIALVCGIRIPLYKLRKVSNRGNQTGEIPLGYSLLKPSDAVSDREAVTCLKK